MSTPMWDFNKGVGLALERSVTNKATPPSFNFETIFFLISFFGGETPRPKYIQKGYIFHSQKSLFRLWKL